eukprot:scaffold14879_cov122-Isochrysis_galbana.AAC.3
MGTCERSQRCRCCTALMVATPFSKVHTTLIVSMEKPNSIAVLAWRQCIERGSAASTSVTAERASSSEGNSERWGSSARSSAAAKAVHRTSRSGVGSAASQGATVASATESANGTYGFTSKIGVPSHRSTPAHEREPDCIRPVRRARRKEARLDTVEPRRPDFGFRGDARIPIEDPEQPDVREGREPFERMGSVERARRMGSQIELELGVSGGHDAALARRSVLLHKRSPDPTDGQHMPWRLRHSVGAPSAARSGAGPAVESGQEARGRVG